MAEFLLEIDRGRDARETAAEDNNACLKIRDFWLGFGGRGAEETLDQTYRSGGEQAERESKKQPADERWKKRAHSFGRPLRHLSCEQRQEDHIDSAPHRQPECRGGHCAIRGCAFTSCRARQGERVCKPQESTNSEAYRDIAETAAE